MSHMSNMSCLSRLLLFAGLLLAPLPALAQGDDFPAEIVPDPAGQPTEEQISERSLALFMNLMSPYCPGATLRDCGSGQAAILRERIRGQIRNGETDQEITDELVAEFGETILSKPRFKGFGMVAYLAPIGALLLGIAALILFLKRQRRSSVQANPDRIQPSAHADAGALRRKLDEELRLRTGG